METIDQNHLALVIGGANDLLPNGEKNSPLWSGPAAPVFEPTSPTAAAAKPDNGLAGWQDRANAWLPWIRSFPENYGLTGADLPTR